MVSARAPNLRKQSRLLYSLSLISRYRALTTLGGALGHAIRAKTKRFSIRLIDPPIKGDREKPVA